MNNKKEIEIKNGKLLVKNDTIEINGSRRDIFYLYVALTYVLKEKNILDDDDILLAITEVLTDSVDIKTDTLEEKETPKTSKNTSDIDKELEELSKNLSEVFKELLGDK